MAGGTEAPAGRKNGEAETWAAGRARVGTDSRAAKAGAGGAPPLGEGAAAKGFARARGTSPGVAPDAASCARATRRARSWTPPRLPRRRRRGGAAAGLGAGAAAGGTRGRLATSGRGGSRAGGRRQEWDSLLLRLVAGDGLR